MKIEDCMIFEVMYIIKFVLYIALIFMQNIIYFYAKYDLDSLESFSWYLP